jgi:hypothetical protein
MTLSNGLERAKRAKNLEDGAGAGARGLLEGFMCHMGRGRAIVAVPVIEIQRIPTMIQTNVQTNGHGLRHRRWVREDFVAADSCDPSNLRERVKE